MNLYQTFSSLLLRRPKVSQMPNNHSYNITVFLPCLFLVSSKIKDPPPPRLPTTKPMIMYVFHERQELLTPSRWGLGKHWFFPGHGEGLQGAQRIGVEASDVLAMTHVHWELSKSKISLCRFLLQKSGYKGT